MRKTWSSRTRGNHDGDKESFVRVKIESQIRRTGATLNREAARLRVTTRSGKEREREMVEEKETRTSRCIGIYRFYAHSASESSRTGSFGRFLSISPRAYQHRNTKDEDLHKTQDVA